MIPTPEEDRSSASNQLLQHLTWLIAILSVSCGFTLATVSRPMGIGALLVFSIYGGIRFWRPLPLAAAPLPTTSMSGLGWCVAGAWSALTVFWYGAPGLFG